MTATKLLLVSATLCVPLLASPAPAQDTTRVTGSVPTLDRTWLGRSWFANRLQDWRITGGRIECVEGAEGRPNRVAHLLTASATDTQGYRVEVMTGPLAEGPAHGAATWHGLLIGTGGPEVDYRLSALAHHRPGADGGLLCVVDGEGRATFRDFEQRKAAGGTWSLGGKLHPEECAELPGVVRAGQGYGEDGPQPVRLALQVEPDTGSDEFRLTLEVHVGGERISSASVAGVPRAHVQGSFGLVSSRGPSGQGHWFRDLLVEGDGLVDRPERAYGPILSALYTVSDDTLKMTVQMPPLGADDPSQAVLEVQHEGGEWTRVAEAELERPAFIYRFRVEGWDTHGRDERGSSRDVPYRVRTQRSSHQGLPVDHEWAGVVRREPGPEEEFVLAAFTGCKHYTGGMTWNEAGLWFPHAQVSRSVAHHDPDLLFFSGDQVYEGDLTGATRRPEHLARLDYHDKWQRWCWAFRDLARTRPTVTITDDHDVYHGNIWGAGGRAARRQDDGGYMMPADFVRMVELTQTSHLPDPFDPTPVEQGIGVYYTDLNWGGVSFAILEDRKFKSSPTAAIPEGDVKNGWFRNAEFDPKARVEGGRRRSDVEGAVLLGERQLEFLRQWSGDFSNNAWMKVVLSQTIFANIATLPPPADTDAVVPGLAMVAPGAYPPNDTFAADCDSNGWPQSGRDAALRELRRAFALHVAGDQHLGSMIHYGIDAHEDAGWAFCVPSVANTFPRRWFPSLGGADRRPGSPRYSGRFTDGFGNLVTVHAVSNPHAYGHEPRLLMDRAPGYGIVRLDRDERAVTVECWPRWADPAHAGHDHGAEENAKNAQYPGWPYRFHMFEGYARAITHVLPPVVVKGMQEPVVHLVDADGELVYALRSRGPVFQAWVFDERAHTLWVGEPGTERWQAVEDLVPYRLGEPGGAAVSVELDG